jgi:hypothetical protein
LKEHVVHRSAKKDLKNIAQHVRSHVLIKLGHFTLEARGRMRFRPKKTPGNEVQRRHHEQNPQDLEDRNELFFVAAVPHDRVLERANPRPASHLA